MAEIVGVIGAGGTIANALLITAKELHNCIRTINDAPQQIVAIARETRIFSGHLDEFEFIANETREQFGEAEARRMRNTRLDITDQSERVLEGLERLLDKVHEFAHPSRWKQLLARFKLYMNQTPVKILMAVLSNARANITASNTALLCRMVLKTIKMLVKEKKEVPAELNRRIVHLQKQLDGQRETTRIEHEHLLDLLENSRSSEEGALVDGVKEMISEWKDMNRFTQKVARKTTSLTDSMTMVSEGSSSQRAMSLGTFSTQEDRLSPEPPRQPTVDGVTRRESQGPERNNWFHPIEDIIVGEQTIGMEPRSQRTELPQPPAATREVTRFISRETQFEDIFQNPAIDHVIEIYRGVCGSQQDPPPRPDTIQADHTSVQEEQIGEKERVIWDNGYEIQEFERERRTKPTRSPRSPSVASFADENSVHGREERRTSPTRSHRLPSVASFADENSVREREEVEWRTASSSTRSRSYGASTSSVEHELSEHKQSLRKPSREQISDEYRAKYYPTETIEERKLRLRRSIASSHKLDERRHRKRQNDSRK
ncbi:hypothetical protein EJ08DRAFT_695695 [Tothia fuscella]|uniref:Fungal N-terminal domain-containing protein n=1 Tax=Tothia fuscella TaxID=1048955 RepID=A0A9P4NVT9_9PEZI|nr:hypothetical protein EJ08DRAFT_695695 [Tothia fuscella]